MLRSLRWPFVPQADYLLTRWIFLRLLALVYLIAFVSLWVQIHGLVGEDGILPVSAVLEFHEARLGAERFHLLPTLCWWDTGDLFLHVLCGAGTVLSLLLLVDFAPVVPALLSLWVFYLSLTTAGSVFLGYQWDALLLETGLVALLMAPPKWSPGLRRETAPRGLSVWLARGLLLRLMMGSGFAKLASGDPAWRDLSALSVHFETQPLPHVLGWMAHQLPEFAHRLGTGGMLLVELVAPLAVFAPRRLRTIAFALLAGLQILIVLTGNYGFFNLLTLALCAWMLDDVAWRRLLPAGIVRAFGAPTERDEIDALIARDARLLAGEDSPWMSPRRAWDALRNLAATALTATFLILGAHRFALQVVSARSWPEVSASVMRWIEPFRSVNAYGLFADMTETRPEILVEGSLDGRTWRPYRFRWKPGPLDRAPRWVQPHMPRLDWQMWFAALGPRPPFWFGTFLHHLLVGTPEVLSLLETNPFPDSPPRYVRAWRTELRFTDLHTLRATGNWWARGRLEVYYPTMSRSNPAP